MRTKSGRDTDKIAACGLTLAYGAGDAPYFEQAELVLVCRKRFAQALDAGNIPQEIREKWYPEKDYHTLYNRGNRGSSAKIRRGAVPRCD